MPRAGMVAWAVTQHKGEWPGVLTTAADPEKAFQTHAGGLEVVCSLQITQHLNWHCANLSRSSTALCRLGRWFFCIAVMGHFLCPETHLRADT